MNALAQHRADAPEFSPWTAARACQAFRRTVLENADDVQRLAALQSAMQATPQGSASVWEHCAQTERCAQRLWHSLEMPADERQAWRQAQGVSWLPEELFEAPLLHRLRSVCSETLFRYLRWHDCGKPFVWMLDEQGRSRYPEHAEASARIWAQAGGSLEECELMRLDMALHTCSAEELATLQRHELMPALLLAAWAALWANCADFGGAASSSFLAKRKHLLRRTRALVRAWQGT